tara:strand:- start:938 stop:1285 length:348 start_codon:yes stop_codon:yes gene_type:complete
MKNLRGKRGNPIICEEIPEWDFDYVIGCDIADNSDKNKGYITRTKDHLVLSYWEKEHIVRIAGSSIKEKHADKEKKPTLFFFFHGIIKNKSELKRMLDRCPKEVIDHWNEIYEKV